ncbi:tRNA uridine-5-carboxymethylaminomethyl(34) synthesis GTPase MnmE [Telluribacter sp.]|jgi:tRNA modification GTPase|uniref:tRNA uridine-5-carboxymethylaminomethyl(34) synthesis GTPase MnmE n=1 Tax=Telluribacter sp. TaxID=1978767 RepID=UPI002E14DEE1|nr:tRNA uridine-5-carboxymethylaminomethyl(34) synthesis GTPase MnmE [Telluribacter sp.]
MIQSTLFQQEAICALATPSGVGAIAVIRVSGLDAVNIVNRIFKGKNLETAESHTAHFGTIRNGDIVVDEVLVTVFRSPRSFTREDAVEISCHGSDYIVRQIIKLLVRQGARVARPGEFTQRAFLNGQFDLVQAEAVADLIAADSEASHRTALNQLRGGFSKKLALLREELIHFASLVELELDFGEEDVEFAQRDDLRQLIHSLQSTIAPLIESFDYGNAIKDGVPVAIIGSPNVGKSTLLNALLNEEKAIVTSIAGTTRDIIEDTIVLEGLKFRFIDTAGIRETQDLVESLGIERSRQAMEKADLVLFLFDSSETFKEIQVLAESLSSHKKVLWVQNKVDLFNLIPRPLLLAGEGEQFPSSSIQKVVEHDTKGNEVFKSLIHKIPEPILENARHLRQTATNAETYLWELLRDRQLNGYKFRRQHPIVEGFVLDFFCAEFRLGVELDGDFHQENEQNQYDTARSEELKQLYNIDIIRFTNEEVLFKTEQVLAAIIEAVEVKKENKAPALPIESYEQSSFPGTGDQSPSSQRREARGGPPRGEVNEIIPISAHTQQGLEVLKHTIVEQVRKQSASDTVVTNLRHYEHLVKTQAALEDVLNGLDMGVTGDFLAQDIRLALHHLGEITGTIVNDDLLANIFSKFCIGK